MNKLKNTFIKGTQNYNYTSFLKLSSQSFFLKDCILN